MVSLIEHSLAKWRVRRLADGSRLKGAAVASRISLFNHKGGVSKTTTTFNLGWMLASKGKRVILVDCDPQCNLTGMIFGFKGATDLERLYQSPKGHNIRDSLGLPLSRVPFLSKQRTASWFPAKRTCFCSRAYRPRRVRGNAWDCTGAVRLSRYSPEPPRFIQLPLRRNC